MKKCFIAILMLAFVVSGCAGTGNQAGPSGDAGAKKVNLTFTIFDDGVGVDRKLVEEFNKTHPNIQVTYKPLPAGELRDRLTTWLAAKDESLDVLGIDVVWPSEFARAGWIVPLDDLMDASMKDKTKTGYLQAPLNAVTVDGKIYGLPWNSTGGLLYYRKDILEKEGLQPPKTWDELIAQAETLGKKNNINGFVGQYKQYEGLVTNVLEFFESYNGHILDDKGKPIVNSPENLKALNTMLKLKPFMPAGVNTYQEKESQETFINGNAVFLRSWNSAWPLIEKEGSQVKGKAGIAPLPKGDNGKDVSTLGGWNLAISKFSKHPKESFEFIKWMTDAQQQKVKAIDGGRLPTDKSLYQDKDVLAKNPAFKDFYDVLTGGVSRPKSAKYGKVSEAIQMEISAAFNGQKKPEQALADLQKKLEDLSK
jgi:multiple sugar transport system substrate-binding protein